MRNFFQKISLLFLFILLTACMLLYHTEAAALSLTGLNLWFQKMIPALLPFMILSGLLIRLNLSDSFARLFSPVLRPLFRLSDSCLYCIVIGFLCGFPMGARVCAESYQRGRLSRKEATLLLAFCNNIGPIYFVSFVLVLFPQESSLPFLAGMYLLPLFYGLFLRYTMYRQIPFSPSRRRSSASSMPMAGRLQTTAVSSPAAPLTLQSLLRQTDDAILSALSSIAALGGYMILFNLLFLIPSLLFVNAPLLSRLSGCLLEITGGLARLQTADAFYAFTLLPFGGLSCIAQTYSMIRDTDLSLPHYIFHKGIQTLLAAAYYTILWRHL